MPSGYSHITFAKLFNEKTNLSEHSLGLLLDEKLKYFQLGALGPDLPYSQIPRFLNSEEKIADDLHYRSTNLVPFYGVQKIKAMQDSDKKDECFAFFLGYISHLVADGIIHPFIRDKVGNYDDHSSEHRALEMRLDVILLDYFSQGTGASVNLNWTNLHDQIMDPLKKDFSHVSNLFSEAINSVYGHKTNKERIEDWVDDMHGMFALAEGNHFQFYSNFPGLDTYFFHDAKDVLKKKDESIWLRNNQAFGRKTNFLNKDINFFDDCLPALFKVLKPIALKVYDYCYGEGKLTSEDIPAINLDTGRSISSTQDGNNLDQPVVCWQGLV
ncbi:MAG: zinc dependent phospholipase C family protein [Bdellovibrio sp.]|nr:zinc dependent phospholipase C family protein [Bdellovibrio sp.]